MSQRDAALTLIELLVATALAMGVIAMAWSLFAQTQTVIRRSSTRAALHQQGALIHANLSGQVATLHPGGLVKAKASTVAGSNATRLDLWYLTTPERTDTTYGHSPRVYENDWDPVAWVKWRWERPAGRLAGTLSMARSPRYWDFRWQGRRVSDAGVGWQTNYRYFRNAPAPRRDADRDLDDNDGRLLNNFLYSHSKNIVAGGEDTGIANAPGDGSSTYPAVSADPANPSNILGDDEILDQQLRMLHPQVIDWRCGWVDASVPATANTALSEGDAAGAGRTIKANGVYLGFIERNTSLWTLDPAFTASPAYAADLAKRPLALRVAFVLVDPAVRLDDPEILKRHTGTTTPTVAQVLAAKTIAWQAFSFSMPVGPIGVTP